MRGLVLVVLATACGGRSANTRSSPEAGHVLTAMDPDLAPVAKAAARSLVPASDGKVHFAGVFVGGRELTALSDTIARWIGAVRTRVGDVRVRSIGERGSAEAATAPTDATYSLTNFRVDGDVGFVGVDAPSASEPRAALCIVLMRATNRWLVDGTSTAARAEDCAGSPRSSGPRDVRLLEKGDPIVKGIAFGAAEYIRATAGTQDVGFDGVFFRRERDVELTQDIINAFQLQGYMNGGSVRTRPNRPSTGFASPRIRRMSRHGVCRRGCRA